MPPATTDDARVRRKYFLRMLCWKEVTMTNEKRVEGVKKGSERAYRQGKKAMSIFQQEDSYPPDPERQLGMLPLVRV